MKKVLIIDDDRYIRSFVNDIFSDIGYKVIGAVNGVEGIRKILRHYPDAVIVDAEMPILSGFAMMKILNLIQLEIPTIMLSGDSNLKDKISTRGNITRYCVKKNMKTELFPLVTDLINNTERKYNDQKYSFTKEEYLGLLGESDRKKILIVEDSRTMLDIMISQLREDGLYEVYRAPDGKEAIIKAVLTKPDLILSDIEMPLIDGASMAQILYVLGHPFPLAFATATHDPDLIKRVEKLEGVKAFWKKNDLLRNKEFLQKEIEKILNIPRKEKIRLRNAYREIDLSKIASI